MEQASAPGLQRGGAHERGLARGAVHQRRGRSPGVLLVADAVRTASPRGASARCVLVRGRRIIWLGDDPAAAPGVVDLRVDLSGATIQPAFVNAHVHLTSVGLVLTGLDLSLARSVEDCLAAVAAISDVTLGRVLWGGGWDETDWPEQRPPTADELSRAGADRPVLLLRSDGHSVVLDRTSLAILPLARVDGVERDETGRPTGVLRREAASVAIRWFAAELPAPQLEEARDAVARQCAALGVGSVHEMAGPGGFGTSDLDTWTSGEWPIEVVPYWSDPDLDLVTARGLRQVGALGLDGTVGSHTAALEEDYVDRAGAGHLYLADDDLAEFMTAATRRRVQVSLHAIGDRAVRQAIEVVERVADTAGLDPVRGCRHRMEHAALLPPELAGRLEHLGMAAIVQPTYDHEFGRRGGLYERRLGTARARRANPIGTLHRTGVALAFGADLGVSALDPWSWVDAAVGHHDPAERLDVTTALRAATLGGRAACRQDTIGPLEPTRRADLAAFTADRECVLTMVAGRIVHGEGAGLLGPATAPAAAGMYRA